MPPPAAALDLAETARRLANVVRAGTVAEVDLAAPRARVRYGADPDGNPVLTGWLPWIGHAAGADRAWRPPSVGEQVVLLAPYGELSAGWILPGAYSENFAAPDASGAKHVLAYRDGAVVFYDSEAHALSAVLPEGATAALNAPGGITVTGDVTIDGDLAVRGNASATGDVEADGSVEAGTNVSDRRGSMQSMRTTYNSHVHGVAPGPVTPPVAPTSRMT